jgi:DNA-binding response OmpR family regulator
MFDSLKDKKILYVEDDTEVLENISELLHNYFEKFYKALDGEKGHNIFLEQDIDICIIDIQLPKMSGIELIKKIRESNKDVYIIVISSHTKIDYFLDCIEYKIEKFIVKPLTTKKIRELLEKIEIDFKSVKIDDSILKLDSEYSINTQTFELSYCGEPVKLTKKERTLIKLFLEYQNRLVSIEIMEHKLWPNKPVSDNRRRSLVSRTRAKLRHRFIETCSSEGYIFRVKD